MTLARGKTLAPDTTPSSHSDVFCTVRDVTVAYGSFKAVKGVSLSLASQSTTGILGPNGSGKSSLVRALTGAQPLAAGTVTFEGEPLNTIRASALAKKLAYVHQFESVPTEMAVLDYVLLGRLAHLGDFQPFSRTDRNLAQASLVSVGLESQVGRKMANLSGGERQRAILARALCQDTPYLVLDEPTNHLDIHHQHQALQRVCSSGKTAVIVLHDLNMAVRYCDDVAVMSAGEVVATGPATSVVTTDLIADVYRMNSIRVETDDYPQFIFGSVIE